MSFRIVRPTSNLPNNMLVYRPDDYAFDVAPTPESGFTSALFDDLNLEVDNTGKVISVWGLCPHTRWKDASLTPPSAEFGEVFFVPEAPLARGVSVQLNEEKYRPVLVDRTSGWVHVTGNSSPVSSVAILNGVILEMDKLNNLCGVWLKPNELPKV